MMKYILDLVVTANERLREGYILLKLTDGKPLPPMFPGQFAELKVEGSDTTFLRRPISINYVDEEKNEVWFLIHEVGDGTRRLGKLSVGDKLNVVMPLGKGFTLPDSVEENVLLVGGGVGTAPLLYMGKKMAEKGCRPSFLLGGRSAGDLMQLDMFRALGKVYITTEDGSLGEKGFVTQHSVWQSERFDRVATCGPKPMMVAVARQAKAEGAECEVSLENLMACGVGACLCCVENTTEGHLCVCKEGPVFNTNRLLWQI
ncbi:MAG: dihydroorotate dehydrogenase electron transfer subunit [Paraprevotella sp.]|nr:dihydroorotate dehydrogenase electron transfer subunit [Paraprevotella sp.]